MPQTLRLVLAGGGTGGHITPNIAIIEELEKRLGKTNLKLLYLGTRKGMEREMMKKLGVPYRGIFCGKLRRYFSLKNLLDFFKVPAGIIQSFFIIIAFRPQVVFCKGGFVSFPVAVAARMAGRKVILHESDVSPGLANRLCARFATLILVAHGETEKYFSACKVEHTGNPVRKWLKEGTKERGRKISGLDADGRKVILFMGGSQGAAVINRFVHKNIGELTARYSVIHICGKGNLAREHAQKNYFQTEYADRELKDFYALCDLIVSRAGSNSLAEFKYVRKPSILLPLGTNASRGDQIENAKIYSKEFPCRVMAEEDLDKDFFKAAEELLKGKNEWHNDEASATDEVVDLILKTA